MNMKREGFVERMEGITLSSNVFESYVKIFEELDEYYDSYFTSITFEDIKKRFDLGLNQYFNKSGFYSNVMTIFLYLIRNEEKLIMGKPIDQYFQELEDSLPLESWKKMLRVISEEKEFVRRIIGGKGKDWDLSTRPIYFHRNYMIIHLMDKKGLKNPLKNILINHPDLFTCKHSFYNPLTNTLHLRGSQKCWDEYEEYLFNKLGVQKEDVKLLAA